MQHDAREYERYWMKSYDANVAEILQQLEFQMMFSSHFQRKKMQFWSILFVVFAVATLLIVLVVIKASNIVVAFVIGLIAAFITAWANAANDICNSVGTCAGCHALTLAQACIFGAFFEIVGALTMGPFMSKSIVKGVIDTEDCRRIMWGVIDHTEDCKSPSPLSRESLTRRIPW